MLNFRISFFLIFFILCSNLDAAHVVESHSGADFLKFGMGARASAMGEAYTAVHSDVTASYWNPAGLAKLERPEFGVMHSKVIDNSLEFIGFSFPVHNYGVLGINGIFLLYEPSPLTLESETIQGYIEWMDWALTLSWGRKVSEYISAGLGAKIIQKRETDPIFGNINGTAYAVDFGIIYEYPYLENLNIGMSLQNLGSEIRMEEEKKSDNLPVTFRIGSSYLTYPFLFTADLTKIIKEDWWANFGLEYELEDLFLRAGYFRKSGNIKGITYGIGVEFNKFKIDWANVPSGEMIGYSRQNRVSMIIQF
jgi:hypothetical protein